MAFFEGELHPFHGCGFQEEESGSMAADVVVAVFGQGEKIPVTVDVCDGNFSKGFVESTNVNAELEEFMDVWFGRWRHVTICGGHNPSRLEMYFDLRWQQGVMALGSWSLLVVRPG